MGTENSSALLRGARRLATAASVLVVCLSACATPSPTTPPLAAARTQLASRTAVLVAIDGVRWQEVFGGVDGALAREKGLSPEEQLDAAHLVPNLHRLMTTDGAAVGAPSATLPMRASGPNFVSLPGYMEMLTGRTDIGCTNNACGDVPYSTIADDVAARGGVAAVIASWPGISHAASATRGRVVMSIGRSGGENRSVLAAEPGLARLLEAGEREGPGPGEGDFRRDASTGAVACAFLGSHRPNFLFVGLGETDEYAHQGDYRGYLRALHDADAVVGRLAAIVESLDASGNSATLLVTTDHGRADGFATHGGDSPESARVWLAATGTGVRARGAAASMTPRRLADVAQTLRRVLGLPRVNAAPAGRVLTELFAPTDATLATR